MSSEACSSLATHHPSLIMDAARLAANALFFIEHYIALALLAFAATLIGRRILGRRITFSGELEESVFSIATGLGAISFLILLIGELHLLYAPVLLGVLGVGIALSYPVLLEWQRSLQRIRSRVRMPWIRAVFGAGILLAVSLPLMVYPLYPAKDWDATQYHLAVAKIYVSQHAVVFTPYLRYPVFPQTNQMLFTGALLVYDEQFAQLIQFLMLVTLCAAMIAFARRYLNAVAGWLSVALLIASPLIVFLGSIAYADIGLALFCFLCTYAFWNWRETAHPAWIIITGVCAGLAFGSKYTGAFFPLLFFLVLAVTEARKRNFRTLLLLTGVTFVVALPWLVRNIHYTGNPIFPFMETFFTGMFGERQINPEWFREQVGASLGIGVERSAVSLLQLPWTMATNNAVFLPEAPLSTIVLWMLPLSCLCAVFRPRVRWLLLLAMAYTVFWFAGYHIVRYLVPAFPIYCLATAGGLEWLISSTRVRGWLSSRVLAALLCGFFVFPCWFYFAQHIKWEGPLPITESERDRYLGARMSSYDAYKFLNTKIGDSYRLYALDEVRMAYFCNGTFMGDYFGEANYDRIRGKMTSGESLYDELKALGATHFLINQKVEKSMLPEDVFFERNFRLLFEVNQTRVFELSAQKITQAP